MKKYNITKLIEVADNVAITIVVFLMILYSLIYVINL